MRYASLFRNTLLTTVSALLLAACASGPARETGSAETPGMLPTEQYLPQRQYDDDGEPLPYEALDNPYTAESQRIERDIVDLYIQARRAFKNQDYHEADRLVVELAAAQPDLSGPLVMRGDIALETENLEGAVDFYEKALEVNPVNFNAYLRLAKVQRMLGEFTRAQNTYADALAKWPDGAELHLNLGVLYDVYLNEPLKAQAHMEAYQFLSGDNSGKVVHWLEEIRDRTGVANALEARREQAEDEQLLSARNTREERDQ